MLQSFDDNLHSSDYIEFILSHKATRYMFVPSGSAKAVNFISRVAARRFNKSEKLDSLL